MYKFELGDRVEHREIGFIGIVRGRVEYLSGDRKYGVRIETMPKNFTMGNSFRWLNGNFLQLHKDN